MQRTTRIFGIAGIVLLTMALSSSLGAPPRPTSLPPVRFQLTLISYPSNHVANGQTAVRDVNEFGEVVGQFTTTEGVNHAFVYSPLVNPLQAIDVHQLVASQVPAGWYLNNLAQINDDGDAVGDLGQFGFSLSERRQGCVIYGLRTASPLLMLLPDRDAPDAQPWALSRGARINDEGLVAGTFTTVSAVNGAYVMDPLLETTPSVLPIDVMWNDVELNNATATRSAQVVGQLASGEVFRFAVDGSALEIFSQFNYNSREQYTVWGLNDAGTFCGRRIVKNKYEAYRYNGSLVTVSNANGGGAVNASGDMSSWGTNPQIYHQGSGLLNLNELVVGSSYDVSQWRNAARFLVDLTQRGAWNSDSAVSNYPGLAGYLTSGTSEEVIFLLTPVKP